MPDCWIKLFTEHSCEDKPAHDTNACTHTPLLGHEWMALVGVSLASRPSEGNAAVSVAQNPASLHLSTPRNTR